MVRHANSLLGGGGPDLKVPKSRQACESMTKKVLQISEISHSLDGPRPVNIPGNSKTAAKILRDIKV